jgi:CRP-like cAMP-binding protein
MNIVQFVNDVRVSGKLKKTFYRKGDILHLENEICEDLTYVEKGELIINSYSLKNEEIIISRLKQFSMLGHILLFATDKHYLGNVISSTDSLIYTLHKEDLFQIIKDNYDLAIFIIQSIADVASQTNQTVKLLSKRNIKDKIMYYLLTLKHQNNSIKIKNISQLAKTLQIKRQSLYRTLKELEKAKILTYKNNTITLI